MIKIFSINEILEATNDFLDKPHKKKVKSIGVNEPLILKDNLSDHKREILNKSNVPKSTEELIYEAEKGRVGLKKKQIDKTNKTTSDIKNNINNLSISEKKDLESEKKIIKEIHHLFKNKVRKSTIKVILDQQKKINSLNENISNLRKNDFKNLKINKKLKDEISHLLNNEKILKFKFEEFQKKLDQFQNKEIELLKLNKKLEQDIIELQNNVSEIKKTNDDLNQNNKNMIKQIDKFIINEKNLIDSNQNIEKNIYLLTNSKNLLSYETKKLSRELKLVEENKKILIINNKKLQKEVKLLTDNKNILIELNEKYQKQNTDMEIIKDKYREEKIHFEKNSQVAEEDKQKLIEDNLKLKEEISNLIANENNLIKEKKQIEFENNSLKNRTILSDTSEERELKKMNSFLQYELSSLRASEKKLIENNSSMHNELSKLRRLNNTVLQEDDRKNFEEKLSFYQSENLRLSEQLSSTKKTYDIMKNQLSKIETEKTDISKKVEDLNKLFSKSNIVETSFKSSANQSDSKKDSANLDIDKEIKKIFGSN